MIRQTAQPPDSSGLAVGKGDGDRTTALELTGLTDFDFALLCSLAGRVLATTASARRPALHRTALLFGYCHIGWLMCFLCRWWWIPGVGESVPLGGVLLLHLHLHLQVLRRQADGHSDYPSVLFADPGPRSAGPAPSPLRPKRPEADGVKGDTDMQVSRADPISKRPQGTWLLLLSSLTSRHAHISVCSDSDRLFIPVMLLHDLVPLHGYWFMFA
jgi:hypothetical protein